MTTESYLVCFALLGEVILPRNPFSFGAFEFSRIADPFPGCEEALISSLAAWQVAAKSPFRLRAFIQAESHRDAVSASSVWAQEVVTLFAQSTFRVARFELTKAGYTFQFRSGHAYPILPPSVPHNFFGTVAIVDDLAVHPQQTLNQLLSVAPDHYGELGLALRRSTHWSELGRSASDKSERLLMYWMACETLTRADRDESLTPKFLAGLGLPGGRYLMALPEHEQTLLKSRSEYRVWRTKLNEVLEKLREARNAIAHSGFRDSDLGHFFSDDERLLVERIFRMLVPRLQVLATNGLALNIKSIEQLWTQYANAVLFHRRQIPLATEAFGTVVYNLSRPKDPFSDGGDY